MQWHVPSREGHHRCKACLCDLACTRRRGAAPAISLWREVPESSHDGRGVEPREEGAALSRVCPQCIGHVVSDRDAPVGGRLRSKRRRQHAGLWRPRQAVWRKRGRYRDRSLGRASRGRGLAGRRLCGRPSCAVCDILPLRRAVKKPLHVLHEGDRRYLREETPRGRETLLPLRRERRKSTGPHRLLRRRRSFPRRCVG